MRRNTKILSLNAVLLVILAAVLSCTAAGVEDTEEVEA